MMQTQWLGTHQGTYDAVVHHRAAGNLRWREVRALLDRISDEVAEEHGGIVTFSRNGETLTVLPPRQKDLSDAAEVTRIRDFLERSAGPKWEVSAGGHKALVVIDHREARIFRTGADGSLPERITPLDAGGSDRRVHNVGNDDNRQRRPEPRTFYASVATMLIGADQILILGSSTGASSAMDHLVAHLLDWQPDISDQIVGALAVNEQHMSDNQLLAQARDFFAASGLVEVTL